MRKNLVIVLFIALALLVSCDESSTPSQFVPSDGLVDVTFYLPDTFTQEDILSLQQLRVYDGEELVKTVYAEDIGSFITIAGSKDLQERYCMHMEFSSGEHCISVKGESASGLIPVVEKHDFNAIAGEKVDILLREFNKDYIYLDFEAFTPDEGKSNITIHFMRNEEKALSVTLNSWFPVRDISIDEGEYDLVIEKGSDLSDFSVWYPEKVTIVDGYTDEIRIRVCLSQEQKDSGDWIPVKYVFDENGKFNYFKSFMIGYWLDTHDDGCSCDNCKHYTLGFAKTPDSGEKTVYIPAGYNDNGPIETSSPLCEIGEQIIVEHNYGQGFTENQSISITTTSAVGATAWVNVTVDPVSEELLKDVNGVLLYYGEKSRENLGSWPSHEWAVKNLKNGFDHWVPVTPGTQKVFCEFWKTAETTVPFELVPSVDSLTTVEGYKYQVHFSVKPI